jgi:hypothetical protein
MKKTFIIFTALFLGAVSFVYADDKTQELTTIIVEHGQQTQIACSCTDCNGCGDVYTIQNLAPKMNLEGFTHFKVWRVKFVDMGEPGWNDWRDAVIVETFDEFGELDVNSYHYDGTVLLDNGLSRLMTKSAMYQTQIRLSLMMIE